MKGYYVTSSLFPFLFIKKESYDIFFFPINRYIEFYNKTNKGEKDILNGTIPKKRYERRNYI